LLCSKNFLARKFSCKATRRNNDCKHKSAEMPAHSKFISPSG
jgi:hypothetical protein